MDGLYLLWWVQEKQMSPALVAATMAAGDLLLMGLEVPTGWFADKFGNRRSLILGSLIQVAGMICCWLADGMSGLVLACLLVSVGDAFRSGADQALLYRTCVELNREGEFQTIEARSRAVHVIALAALIVAGGAIVSRWGFAAGWMAEILLCATGGLIACAMVEPPERAGDDQDDATPSGMRIPWRLAAAVILPLAFLDAITSAGSFILQTTRGSGPGEVTVIVALITLADAAGSTLAMRLPAAGLRAQSALAAVGAIVAGIAVTIPSALVPATIALAFATGVSHPLRAAAIQRMTSDSMRARAASAANACDMAFSTVVLLLAGNLLAGRP
ncbi:MAG TPA: MFS transporter [Vicinamibacterales bacterium]|nr:MFS transporter [Vicinamibacterales bacterium]